MPSDREQHPLAPDNSPEKQTATTTMRASSSAPQRVMVQISLIGCFLLCCCAFGGAQQTTAPAAAAPEAAQPYTAGPIVINEVLGKPANDSSALASTADWGVITGSVEWVELANRGSSEVDVSGWTVVRADRSPSSDGWQIPPGVNVPAGGVMVILFPSKKQVLPAIPPASNVQVASKVKVGSNGIALYKPDNSLAASTGRLPENMPGVTVGLPQPPPAADNSPYTYLERPTPFVGNAGAKPGVGPFVRSIKSKPEGAATAGSPITVTAKVRRNQAPVGSVVLLVRINYTPEQQIAMTAQEGGGDAASGGEVTYTATIPGSLITAGSMIRWRVQAKDKASGTTLQPNALVKGEPQYEGTVVPNAAAEMLATNVTIPVLYWYTENPAAATTKNGFPGSLSFNGVFYDNVFGARRGVTSSVWPKAKLRFKVPNGFTMREDVPEMDEVLLNSYYYEVGERSFMKEALAYKVMADEGVVAPQNQYVQLYLNGQFYGLYGMIEKIDNNMLDRYNLPNGLIFKSESGELSNLRWDLPLPEMPSYYSRANRKQYTWEWGLLANLTRGLAGGGPGTRTSFLFDAVNLPAVVNENAVQTLLLNQDRCTKNFLVYHNTDTKEWSRIPWDVETSFAQDNGLGGAPGDLYCVLACEQWNSPLYCDSEHPQDLGGIKTTWGTITAVGMNPYQGSAVPSTGRRLAQQQQSSSPLPAEGTKPLTFPTSDDWANPDRVQYGTRSIIGAAGTYNHLTDALLDVEGTRAMYMRRLRTLADKYYGQGKLRALVDSTWARIRPLAAQDNTIWKQGDGSRGYAQITTEFIPIRAKQLLQTYGPGGANPLLPGPQDNSQVSLGIDAVESANPRSQSYIALAVRSPAGAAVDVSGWKVTAGSATWSFPAGTVIPPGRKLYLTPSVAAFRGRATSPKAGESVFVIEAPDALIPTGGGGSVNWSIVDENGASVRLS